MGRKAGIWFRKQNKTWYVNYNGKQINLGKDKEAAEKQFHKLMALDEPPTASITAAELMDKFLLWCRENRAEGTFDWYTKHLQSFLDHLPDQNIEAINVKPFHVYSAAKKTWSPSYKRGFMVAAQRAFTWGLKQGYIGDSPLKYLEKPRATRRDNCPSQADYDAILKQVDDGFKDLLEFCWETGCRPQEVFQLRHEHVKGNRIEFAVNESKGKKTKRVVYLTAKAEKLVKGSSGFVFTNRNGNPWNSSNVGCRMSRIEEKTGKRFSLYDFRHAFATRMLEAGLDHLTVAKLMGHRDASMISRVYSHIGEKNDYLLNQLRKVS